MKKKLSEILLSVLDLATIVEGDKPSDSFRKSLEVAKRAEQLGYNCYWFAEHHNMENIASSATSVLIGYIAGNTSSIQARIFKIIFYQHT